MEKYIKVKKLIEDNGCILLTTFNEFKEKLKDIKDNYDKIRIEFIGICSHKSNVVIVNFKYRKTGLRCKNCTKNNAINILKEKDKYNTVEIEYKSILMLNDYLLEYYEVERTPEGCKADIIIKHLDEKDDLWHPLQVKSTNKKSNVGMYSFNIKKYDNMILICICISENKIWIIPCNDIKVKNKLNISSNSKYNKYLVTNNLEINKFIEKYTDNIKKESLKLWFTPQNILQKREQEYRLKREIFIPFLEYKYPEIQGTCADFIINGKKIQEKLIGYRKDRQKLSCDLAKNGGKLNGIRNTKSYDKGDNDYYWLHSSIDNRFWIIPEEVLIREGYIITDVKKKTKRVLTFNFEWLKLY